MPGGESSRATVLTVAFPYAPMGRCAVGGAEVVCSAVERAAVAAGFRSRVVAHAGSQPAGELYGTAVPDGPTTEEVRAKVEAEHQRNIDRACAERDVALVHMHGLDFHRYRIPGEIPVLVTLHLPPAWYPASIWELGERYHLLCVSESQWQRCPPGARDRLGLVPNGVPIPPAAELHKRGKYALMMARICPEKNLHAGMDAAQRAGMPVILAGEVFGYPEHQRYFAEEIAPRLTQQAGKHTPAGTTPELRPPVRFVGPVAGTEKERLLTRAACLLMPSLAEETSSLVSMEALAAGVPVVGMRVGAMEEIVREGITGFLVSPGATSVGAMADALQQVGQLDRGACYHDASQRFRQEAMHARYLALYDQHLRRTAPAEPPRALPREAEQPLVRGELLGCTEELEALEPEWRDIWQEDPRATPFQHPAWLLPWWRQFGPDGRLHAWTLRDEAGRLVGLLPSYLYSEPASGQRLLLLAGAGTTDYLDGIWRRGQKAVAEEALRCVVQQAECWDRIAWQQLAPESPLTKAAMQAGWQIGPAEPCSKIDLHLPLPAKIRLNLGRYRRRAARRGSLQVHVAASPAEALNAFEELARLHGQRWRERGEAGVLEDERVLRHHREAIPLLWGAGLLRMISLRLGDEVLGVLYGLASPEHVSTREMLLYLIGFDLRFGELSPGTLLLGAVWEAAQAEGFAALNLLRGGEAYKHFWGAQAQPLCTVSR